MKRGKRRCGHNRALRLGSVHRLRITGNNAGISGRSSDSVNGIGLSVHAVGSRTLFVFTLFENWPRIS